MKTKTNNFQIGRFLVNWGAIVAMVMAFVIFSVTAPQAFFSWANMVTILRSISITTVIALGATFAFSTGVMDLSIGSTATMAAALSVTFIAWYGIPMPIAILLTLIICMAIGGVNAFFVIKTHVPAFLATLAMQFVLDGAELTYSGGALINDMGQVIGITNMKLMAYNSTVEGLGFAIPSRTAKTVVDDLIGYGVVKGRPMLGITVRPLTAEERTGRSLDHGLWVEQVEEKSDAWTQGIRTGDVLLSANGVELSVNDDLLELKNALAVGETIQFCLWREGETLDITVELVEQYSLE